MDSEVDQHMVEYFVSSENENMVTSHDNFIFSSSGSGLENQMFILHKSMY